LKAGFGEHQQFIHQRRHFLNLIAKRFEAGLVRVLDFLFKDSEGELNAGDGRG